MYFQSHLFGDALEPLPSADLRVEVLSKEKNHFESVQNKHRLK